MNCISNSDDCTHVGDNSQILEEFCYLSNVDADSGPPTKKAKRPLRSNAWNYFVKIGIGEDGKGKCKCKACGQIYTCSSNSGTSTLNSHILRCPNRSKSLNMTGDKVDHRPDEELVVRKLDQKVVRDLMTQMVIQHDLPFQFVECEGFRALTKYLSSDEVQCVSKDAVIDDVMNVYMLEKEKLKSQLARISGRVCLTLHCWTASATSGYIALTAHYVDEDWKLNNKLLNFCPLEPPHTDFKLSNKVFDCLEEWGIEKKIFSVTLDNTSSDATLQTLKVRLCLSDSLVSNGDFFHVKRYAHFLDRIVGEGLKEATVVLDKIRESVKYVTLSESRLRQFNQCVEKVGGVNSTAGLHLDVSFTWRSTFLMLESATRYRSAFNRLHLTDTKYEHNPTYEEWARVEKICEILWPFYSLATMISKSTYPASPTCIWRIWNTMINLKENKLDDDVMVRDMVSKMIDEFDKYLSEHSMILSFVIVLNPRLKFETLEFVYSQLDSNTKVVEEKLRNVRKALDALLNEYSSKYAPTSNCPCTSTDNGERKKTWLEERRERQENERQKAYAAGKTQLDLYLVEPSDEDIKKSEVLDYWKEKARIFGALAMMARDILSVPLVTASCNSAYGIGCSIWNEQKSCAFSKNPEALMCSRNWLYGFPHRDQFGGKIVETHKMDIHLFKHDSKEQEGRLMAWKDSSKL